MKRNWWWWIFLWCLGCPPAGAVITYLESGTDATQDFSFFATTAGTVASATNQANTGPRSVELSTGSPAVTARVSTSSGVATDTGTQVSFYFRADTIPTADDNILFILQGGGSAIYALGLRTTGKLLNAPQGATSVTGTATLSTNTWYRITLSYYIGNLTNFSFKVYVNGVLDSTATAGTLTRQTSSIVRWLNSSTGGTNINFWFDDLYVATGVADNTTQPDTGDVRVTAKRPNANGKLNQFGTPIGSGGSGYGTGHSSQVNEQPLSTTNGWSTINAGSVLSEQYNVEDEATGDVNIAGKNILGIAGWVQAKSLLAETGKIIVDGETSNISLTTTSTLFGKIATETEFPNGIGEDIGIQSDATVTTVSLYECGILVAYAPASTEGFFHFFQ